jgi:Cd2+/Zn2+-exporting ATPase/Cu+-exporting ATPase
MENINNMGKNSLEALSRDNLTDAGRRRLTREIICGAATLCCLLVGLIYTYVLGNAYPIVPQMLYFVGFLIEGLPVIYTGIKGLFTKNLTNAMEILVAVAIVACVFNQELILALLIPLILNIAHLLEERSIMGGRDVIDGLKKMQQTTAILLEDGEERVVDVKGLKIGQRIVVKPGAGIPVDGTVVSGASNIDQKSLTGEPQPAAVGEGDPVYAGTVNLDGRIIVEVEKEHVDTSFSKILKLLENSEQIAAPESRLMDRFLGYYIPFVLGVAALVALVSRDISKAIAILVVSCPCGQMLVSSAPMIAALSVATKRGVLIKNSKFIEELTEIDTVVFDKTGTITKGELSLTDVIPADGVDKAELLRAATAVAVASTHPVSRAVVEYATAKEVEYEKEIAVKEISGGGVEGTLRSGAVIRFGRREWLAESGCVIPADLGSEAMGSISFVAVNDRLLGCLCFNDTLREDAKTSVDALRELGAERTVMLTGDRTAPAKRICESVGIDQLHAELLPQDKLDRLRELGGDEHGVLVVGDGINDALALREADVGIAMGAMGSDLAIESADIALMNNKLENIPFVVSLAKKTRKTIYQNLALSILISVFMIGLSAFGIISSLAGSIFHNVGAFAVLLNSSRILRFNKDK